MQMILRNSVICNNCKEKIVSKYRHDFVTCKCGKISIDGGHDYQKITFNKSDDYTETSIDDNGSHELRRQHLMWGKNYDVDMNKLPKTEWVTIENLDTDHIKAIIANDYIKPDTYYWNVFNDELKFRENGE